MEKISKFVVILAILIVLVFLFVDYLYFDHVAPCDRPGKYTDFVALTYQQLSEMNRYLISLSTLVLGGVAIISMSCNNLRSLTNKREAIALICAATLFGVASLYFAFVSHIRIADATIAQCIEFGGAMREAQRFQFYTVLLAAITGIYLAIRYISFER